MHVAVVGAGIIGAAVAHELAARGARVSMFERRGIARGASWASAGVLAPWIEAEGRGPLLEMCAASLALYDDFVERVRRDSGVAVEYTRAGTVEVATTREQVSALQRTAGGLAREGVRASWLDAQEARALEPALSSAILGALHIADHGFVAMPNLVDALAVAARMRGAELQAPIDVTKIEPAPGGKVRIHTSLEPHIVDHVVIAAGSWTNRLRAGNAHVKPVKGQLARLRFDTPVATRVLWSEHCYMVPWQDGTLLVGATMEDVGFDERPTASAASTLLAAATAIVPAAADAQLVDLRAGLRPAIDASIPEIGPSPNLEHVTLAVGHFRNGVLLAPLTARRVAQHLFG